MLVHPATGSILSPNYPNNYPLSTSCNWRLSGTGFTGIVLTVVDLEKETDDYLSASSDDQNLFYIYTANMQTVFELVGNNISLEFNSDHKITFRGFNITYTTFLGQFQEKY